MPDGRLRLILPIMGLKIEEGAAETVAAIAAMPNRERDAHKDVFKRFMDKDKKMNRQFLSAKRVTRTKLSKQSYQEGIRLVLGNASTSLSIRLILQKFQRYYDYLRVLNMTSILMKCSIYTDTAVALWQLSSKFSNVPHFCTKKRMD